MMTEIRKVTNRVFLVGLDELYRTAMKRHERDELLNCAEQIAGDLSLAPADVPVEGYYSEDESLTRYFRIMRALQAQSKDRAPEVRATDALGRLQQVTQSPLYGDSAPHETDSLFGASRDAMFYALEAAEPRWSVRRLVPLAYKSALESDRFSLVDLAALAKDPVVLAGLRESVVLYAAKATLGMSCPGNPKYLWAVDGMIEERASLFVDEFNSLFAEMLPRPCAENASVFWEASDIHGLAGRCVNLGNEDTSTPIRYYHWAIDRKLFGGLKVHEFWDSELWTTQRYKEKKGY